MTETNDANGYFPYTGEYPILNFFHITYHKKEICQAIGNPATRRETFEKLSITDPETQRLLLPKSHDGPIPESAWTLLRKEIGNAKPDGAW